MPMFEKRQMNPSPPPGGAATIYPPEQDACVGIIVELVMKVRYTLPHRSVPIHLSYSSVLLLRPKYVAQSLDPELLNLRMKISEEPCALLLNLPWKKVPEIG